MAALHPSRSVTQFGDVTSSTLKCSVCVCGGGTLSIDDRWTKICFERNLREIRDQEDGRQTDMGQRYQKVRQSQLGKHWTRSLYVETSTDKLLLYQSRPATLRGHLSVRPTHGTGWLWFWYMFYPPGFRLWRRRYCARALTRTYKFSNDLCIHLRKHFVFKCRQQLKTRVLNTCQSKQVYLFRQDAELLE